MACGLCHTRGLVHIMPDLPPDDPVASCLSCSARQPGLPMVSGLNSRHHPATACLAQRHLWLIGLCRVQAPLCTWPRTWAAHSSLLQAGRGALAGQAGGVHKPSCCMFLPWGAELTELTAGVVWGSSLPHTPAGIMGLPAQPSTASLVLQFTHVGFLLQLPQPCSEGTLAAVLRHSGPITFYGPCGPA